MTQALYAHMNNKRKKIITTKKKKKKMGLIHPHMATGRIKDHYSWHSALAVVNLFIPKDDIKYKNVKKNKSNVVHIL
jgi:hypothetical protein